jgi:hypothetical protein
MNDRNPTNKSNVIPMPQMWKPATLAGLPEDFIIKEMVSERLSLINSLAHAAEDPELLRWLRNRLSEPFAIAQKRLKAIESENVDPGLPKAACVK